MDRRRPARRDLVPALVAAALCVAVGAVFDGAGAGPVDRWPMAALCGAVAGGTIWAIHALRR